MPWDLTSHEKLVEAGYLYRCVISCRRCGREVLLYALPGGSGRAMAIERGTYLPHRSKCKSQTTEQAKQKELF